MLLNLQNTEKLAPIPRWSVEVLKGNKKYFLKHVKHGKLSIVSGDSKEFCLQISEVESMLTS